LGKTVAILVPSVIFGLLHAIGKDLYLIDLLMLLVGGTLVGIMFSLIVYESGSIWNSVFVHGLWNFIVGGGVLHIGTTHSDSSVFSYKLINDSPLLTGENLGIDISVIAILGYLVVIVSILLLLNKRKTKK